MFSSFKQENTIQPSSVGTNNVYNNYPGFMEDSRTFTQWNSESVIDNALMEKNNIHTNWNYRQFLQKNGNTIRASNMMESMREDGYVQYQESIFPNNDMNHPYLCTSTRDHTQPNGYTQSDLKTIYLSSSQLDARRIAPSMNQYEVMQFVNQQIGSNSEQQGI